MKNELEKRIKKIVEEAGTAAAAEKASELTDSLSAQYDEALSKGRTELEAYKEALSNIDEIKKIISEMPSTDAEIEKKESAQRFKNSKKFIGKISELMWLLIIIMYFLVSFSTGKWHLTWLIFIWGSINQSLLEMVKSYNKEKNLKKVLKKGLSSILWLATVIFYILISFSSGWWHLTWLIFIVAVIVQKIINMI